MHSLRVAHVFQYKAFIYDSCINILSKKICCIYVSSHLGTMALLILESEGWKLMNLVWSYNWRLNLYEFLLGTNIKWICLFTFGRVLTIHAYMLRGFSNYFNSILTDQKVKLFLFCLLEKIYRYIFFYILFYLPKI